MSRIAIVSSADNKPVDILSIPGVALTANIKTRSVMAEEGRSICLHIHEMGAGTAVKWSDASVGHAIFVWKGDVVANGQPVNEGGAIIVEHGGTTAVVAGAKGSVLAHFNSRMPDEKMLNREGGHVHVLGPEGSFQRVTRADGSNAVVFADSACPTCEIWLHRSNLPKDTVVVPHYHTEDEIIFVCRGSMVVGSRVLDPGSAVVIPGKTAYGFRAGDDGLSFVNFRATDPSIVLMAKDRAMTEPLSEREILTGTLKPDALSSFTAAIQKRS